MVAKACGNDVPRYIHWLLFVSFLLTSLSFCCMHVDVYSVNLLFNYYRLTFWLSKSIVLRTIISQATGDPELPKSARSSIDRNGGEKVHKASSPIHLNGRLRPLGRSKG